MQHLIRWIYSKHKVAIIILIQLSISWYTFWLNSVDLSWYTNALCQPYWGIIMHEHGRIETTTKRMPWFKALYKLLIHHMNHILGHGTLRTGVMVEKSTDSVYSLVTAWVIKSLSMQKAKRDFELKFGLSNSPKKYLAKPRNKPFIIIQWLLGQIHYIDGLVQDRCNYNALAMELHLSFTNQLTLW